MSGAIIWGLDAADFKTLGLVVFLAFFVIVILRLLLSRPGRYRRAARLPLQDDDPPRRAGDVDSGRSEP